MPPADCVVTAVSVPHVDPLHPCPVSDQLSAWFGFDPATGVNVATIAAVALGTTFVGAVNCNEKLLVMVTVVEACLDGSAMLWALSVTVAGEGKIWGAV